MAVLINQFEKLFHKATGLETDQNDIDRLNLFVLTQLKNLLLLGQVSAKINNRNIIYLSDLPISERLQLGIQLFKNMGDKLNVQSILEQHNTHPALKLKYSAMLDSKIPEIIGGIVVNLAEAFRMLDPQLKRPSEGDWEKIEEVYHLL